MPAGPALPGTKHSAPSPWLAGLVVFLATGARFSLLDLPAGLRAGAVVLVPMLAEVILAVGVIGLLKW